MEDPDTAVVGEDGMVIGSAGAFSHSLFSRRTTRSGHPLHRRPKQRILAFLQVSNVVLGLGQALILLMMQHQAEIWDVNEGQDGEGEVEFPFPHFSASVKVA